MAHEVHANKLQSRSGSSGSVPRREDEDASLFKRSPLPPPTVDWSSSHDSEDQIPLDMTLPARPQSHKEFVEQRIENENLPPGFTDIRFASYILRSVLVQSRNAVPHEDLD